MQRFALSLVTVPFLMAAAGASAQPAPPGTVQVPKSPDERNWYPQSNIYTPEDLIGVWFWIDGTTLRQESRQPAQGLVIKTSYINNQAYSYNRTKDTEASAKIPAFASVSLQDKETESLTIDDISTSTLKTDVGEPFCREWPTMKGRRTWAVGDQLIYIVSDQLSHVAWKVGKEKDLSGGGGIGNYFSAEGKQYEQTSISAILPANSFPQAIYKTITATDLAGNPCPAAAAPHHAMLAKAKAPLLRTTQAVLLTNK